MKKIGFIGLGNMGSKMVLNLLKANYEVVGYDINENFTNSLVPSGLKKVSSLTDLSTDIDILITMLPNGDIVEKVYDNIVNNFKKNTLFTDCSTIDVDKAKDLHEKCIKKAFPIIFSLGTKPQYLLSILLSLLSPKTKKLPAGTLISRFVVSEFVFLI